MKKTVICPACGMDQSNVKECTTEKVRINGIGYHRIRYGSSQEGFGPVIGKCMGCSVRPGKNHHWNCLYEICPACHRQMINCDCVKEMMD